MFRAAVATSSTSQQQTNPDGSISIQPLASGKEDFRAHTQRLPVRGWLEYQWRPGPWQFSARWYKQGLYDGQRVAAAWHNDSLSLQGAWLTQVDALELGLRSEHIYLAVASDSTAVSRARYLQAQLSLRYEF